MLRYQTLFFYILLDMHEKSIKLYRVVCHSIGHFVLRNLKNINGLINLLQAMICYILKVI